MTKKLRLLVHSRSFLANQKVRIAIVGVENLLKQHVPNNTALSLTIHFTLQYWLGLSTFGWSLLLGFISGHKEALLEGVVTGKLDLLLIQCHKTAATYM